MEGEKYINKNEAALKVGGRKLQPSDIPIPSGIQQQINDLQHAVFARQRAGFVAGEVSGAGPILSGVWDEIRRDLSEFFKEEWTRRRRLGIERRVTEVKERLAGEPEMPDWLRLIPEGVLTPRQHEAAVLRFGYGLSLAEAAEAAGVSKSAMRDRIRCAEAKIERCWTAPYDEGADIIISAALRMAYRLRTWDLLWDRAPVEARTTPPENAPTN